jgi:hypothetical protein
LAHHNSLKLGLGLGIGIPVLLAICGGLWILHRRRQQGNQKSRAKGDYHNEEWMKLGPSATDARELEALDKPTELMDIEASELSASKEASNTSRHPGVDSAPRYELTGSSVGEAVSRENGVQEHVRHSED